MIKVSLDQQLALLTALGANMNWDSLSVEEVQRCIEGVKRIGSVFTGLVKCGFVAESGAPPAPPSLLTLLRCDISIPELQEPLIVRQAFNKKSADVRFSYIDPDLLKWFDQPVAPRAACFLTSHTLTQDAHDADIMVEIGADYLVDPTILLHLLLQQPYGPQSAEGPLITNGHANTFYMKDGKVLLRTVSAYWAGDGWSFYAYPAPRLRRWNAGNRVISRYSHLLHPERENA